MPGNFLLVLRLRRRIPEGNDMGDGGAPGILILEKRSQFIDAADGEVG